MLIGICGNFEDDRFYLPKFYVDAVIKAGGLPVILPVIRENMTEYVAEIAEYLEGLILAGGGDPSPILWQEEPHYNLGKVDLYRDKFELALTKKMAEMDKPILGICRGMQILNVAFGGSLWQNLLERSDYMCHKQSLYLNQYWHKVSLSSTLAGVLFNEVADVNENLDEITIFVNSNHHQGVRRLGENLAVGAVAADGLVEAIYSEKHRHILGVQWHPERLDDAVSEKIFKNFVKICGK